MYVTLNMPSKYQSAAIFKIVYDQQHD